MEELTVTVDREICIGAGQCEVAAPSTFEVDEDGISRVIDAGGDGVAEVRDAVQSCPSGAISASVDGVPLE